MILTQGTIYMQIHHSLIHLTGLEDRIESELGGIPFAVRWLVCVHLFSSLYWLEEDQHSLIKMLPITCSLLKSNCCE